MKLMSKLVSKFVVLASLTLVGIMLGTTGCVHPTLPGGSSTNVVDTVKLQNSALLLKGVVRDALILVIDKNGTNARPYIVLASSALTAFIDSDAAKTPDALLKALSALPAQALSKAEVKLAISTVVTAYEIYYGQYVRNAVNGNEVAATLLRAIRDGCSDALLLSP